ncbi:hypothetical protein ACVWZM_007875 [Bradyrhizobium sp. USDA 4501]
MLKRNWALIALVYLAFAEVLSWGPVPDLSLCLIKPEHGQQATNHDDKKYCPAFHTGVIASLDALDGFLEHHDKSVVGGFTIVLAISTIGLWLATNKLWRAGERQFELLAQTAADQSRDMGASIAIAKNAADASSKQTEALQHQLALLEMDQRPWLKAQFEIIKPLVFGKRDFPRTLSAAI